MHTRLSELEFVMVLVVACYGGVIGAAMAIAYALCRAA